MYQSLHAIKQNAANSRSMRQLSSSCLSLARRSPTIQKLPQANTGNDPHPHPPPLLLAPILSHEPTPVPSIQTRNLRPDPETASTSQASPLVAADDPPISPPRLDDDNPSTTKVHPDRPKRPQRPPITPVPHNPDLDLHHLVTTQQRTPSQSHLDAAQFFFRSFPPKLVHSLHRFSRESKIPSLGNYPEVAFLGPSNAGKSSLLNAMTIKPMGTTSSKAARTSQRPGSTQTVNFYNVGDRLTLVDMMGYGIGSRKEWGAAIEGYLSNRSELKHVFWLLPAHPSHPDEFDLAIRDLLLSLNVPHTVVLTQIDRIPSTNAFLRVLDNVHRQIVDPMGGFCSSVLPTASVDKFVPQWDAARLGTGMVAKELRKVMAESNVSKRDGELALGWVTAASDQVKVQQPGAAKPSTKGQPFTLSRPGVAHVQMQVLKAAGQDMEKWRIKMKRAGMGGVKKRLRTASPVFA